MKTYVLFLSIIIFVVSLASFTSAGHDHMVIPYETQALGSKVIMPIPSGGDLRHHITSDDPPYKTWELWPGKGKMYTGTKPHGALLTTYLNDIAFKSLNKKKGFRNNSIILKENYTPEKKLAAVTVMYKVKGYDSAKGDWFWVKYDPNFEILAEGKVKGCVACHGTAKDNDYVFTGKVK
jgi:hypothetical protein